MKFTVEVERLQGAMNHIISLFQSGMGVYSLDTLISTDGSKRLLVECSANGAYFSEVIEGVKVEEKGHMSISVYYLYGLSLPGDTITIDASKKSMSFSCGRLKGKFDALGDGDPVERIKDKHLDKAVTLDANLFSKLVDAILFRPTVDDGSMSLRFQADKGKRKFKVLTADTYRAAVYEVKSAKSDKVFKEEKKDEEEKPKKGTKKEKDKADKKEAVKKFRHSVYVSKDFDYVIPSGLLVAIKSLFDGKLEMAANDKVIRMSDGTVTIYHPSQTKDVGEKVGEFMKGLRGQDPHVVAEFDPGDANSIIVSACSIASSDEGKVTLVPSKDRIELKVRADHAETKASFDCKVTGGKKKDKPFQVTSKYFTEFLSLIDLFGDKGVSMKVWHNSLALETNEATYIMPLVGD